MQFAAGGIPGRSAIHFVGSLAVCGAIATAYPFFLLTFYIVRSVYPELVAHGQTNPREAEQLRALSRRLPRYPAIAAAVPLLGIVAASLLTAVASESWCKSTGRFTTSPSAYGLRNSGGRPARSCR